VAGGGTGDTSFTAYSVICGGTTSTGALQNVSGVGTSGQVLTSNGASALPTWQAAGGGSLTVTGDSGSMSGSSLTLYADNAALTCGSSVEFVNSGTTSTMKVTDSNSNTMLGNGAGKSGMSGSYNAAFGNIAMAAATTAGSCAAFGASALNKYTGGINDGHTSIGAGTLGNLTGGEYNVVLGIGSGVNYTSTESNNILIGGNVGGNTGESHIIRIGNQGSSHYQQNACYIAGIQGVSVSNLNIVTINTSTGQLGSQAATNVGTITQYDVLVGDASGAIASVGPGTSGQLLVSGGNAANPSYKSFSVNIQTFTGSGTYTPTSGMVACLIEAVGNGGGGGGTANTSSSFIAIGGGGGGGGYSRKFASASTIGSSKTVTIGATGSGGASGNNNGTSGGDVSVGSICIGKGGTGGTGNSGSSTPAGGAGGVAGTGDFSVPGQLGGNGGNSALIPTIFQLIVGIGGAAGLGFGFPGGPTTTQPQTGVAGKNYGAGGGGGCSYNADGAAAGGAGATGIVVITEYIIA
jgi:hypothetical protein